MPEHLQAPDKLQDVAGEIEAPLRRRRIQALRRVRPGEGRSQDDRGGSA